MISTPVVSTEGGSVRGYSAEGVHIFKGIPYGASTAGDRRFLAPQKAAPWKGVRDTVEYGPLAIQKVPSEGPYATYEAKTLMQGASAQWDKVAYSEDCLVLNVWTPGLGDGRKRPVMFWCHGGGQWYGTGGTDWTDGENLARHHDVVVVAVNHRLNIFGYLYLAELGGEKYADSGNAGLLDIVRALQWVRANIEAFGGDPDNVTLFGQSGGGSKVSALMAMPSAKGLFHKAIVQSASLARTVLPSHATETALRVLRHLGLTPQQVDRLQQVPVDALSDAMSAILGQAAQNIPRLTLDIWFSFFFPVLDGRNLQIHPFYPTAPAISADVPLLVGTTGDEVRLYFGAADQSLFSLADADLPGKMREMGLDDEQGRYLITTYRHTRPDATPTDIFFAIASDKAWRINIIAKAERKLALAGAPVYLYSFDWETPAFGGKYKSCHGVDVPFVFNTIEHASGMIDADDKNRRLAEVTSKAWAEFARTGNPNHRGLPLWKPYTLDERATMIFDRECAIVNDPRGEERVAMNRILNPV